MDISEVIKELQEMGESIKNTQAEIRQLFKEAWEAIEWEGYED